MATFGDVNPIGDLTEQEKELILQRRDYIRRHQQNKKTFAQKAMEVLRQLTPQERCTFEFFIMGPKINVFDTKTRIEYWKETVLDYGLRLVQ
jgi:hypothetical protein